MEELEIPSTIVDPNFPSWSGERHQLLPENTTGKTLTRNVGHAAEGEIPFTAAPRERIFVVTPAEPLEERWIQLSVLDKFILPIYIPVYFIYEHVPSNAFDDFVLKLQESLAHVLVPFYPYAGRLEKNPATNALELHCDNLGAEFRVAYVSEELRESCFSKPCLQLRLITPKLDAVPRDGGSPVPALCVQVIRFRCGAVALGCSFHHQAGDAYAVSLFIQAWSQLATGKPVDAKPVHDRSLLIPSETRDESKASAAPAAIVGTREEVSAAQNIEMKKPAEDDDDFRDGALEGYLLDDAAIAKLKAMAPGATSFEAVTAFMARHAIKAKSAAPVDDDNDDKLAKFVLMVDFRGKVGATWYAGNAALPKAVICGRDVFLGGGLDNATRPVHAAVTSSDLDYFRTFVRHAGRGPPSKERALAVSSCARLPLYDADFGWGPPSFAGVMPPVPRLVPEFLLLLPAAHGSGGIVAYLQLRADILEAVERDAEFSSIVKKYRPLQAPSSRI